MKKKRTNFKGIVDKLQQRIEKIDLKEIKQENKRHLFVDFCMVVLTLLVIFGILSGFLHIFAKDVNPFIGFLPIVLLLILLWGLWNRKRWAWYYGLIVLTLGLIGNVLAQEVLGTLLMLILLFILGFHKEYMYR